ncbi:hypothetical protein NEOLEDRAFT_1183451 [Neolentinus lepideus HHB14362 ss-1]|uniref:Chromo domain-containing protein n=1 Tax=Neolentinus lepideus HHB14362 ss-1 TaxID=1314782 RepID=A0A165N9L9_9AGAM|nr:hypothetical protein NEOLEDRAFT_1183451 [Neolentinus lepideus HHB14362 ss-1]
MSLNLCPTLTVLTRYAPTSNIFPEFHASLLTPYHPNDPDLYPEGQPPHPGPIITPNGKEEWQVKKIVNACCCSRGWQYLMRWSGYDAADNTWLLRHELDDCEALDEWLAQHPQD